MGFFSLASWRRLPYRIIAEYSQKQYQRSGNLAFYDLLKGSNELESFYADADWWTHIQDYAMFVCRINPMIRLIANKTMVSASAVIEDNVTVKGPVVICNNVRIRSGSYIVGPALIGDNSLIGPNCFLNGNLVIGPDAKITQGAELKNALLKRNVAMYHFSYIGDSLIGENVNVAAGVITAVQRFDKADIRLHLSSSKLETSCSKYGAIIGDNVQLGVGTIILPGRTIAPGATVPPGHIVRKNFSPEAS